MQVLLLTGIVQIILLINNRGLESQGKRNSDFNLESLFSQYDVILGHKIW